ncbi:hypothetical protein WOLCODRAFT_150450 [Wolfiporia cocos MD-104 SS10]|uniref:Uncharacterized protein n=1 Tax=Wolfiporia cocos (strain MD-104) TaxID=742152 RepID=A0A2H3JUM6_WOLCO|nr:hypothetical protein WOLCODRAFT_150450 [Wolfiporia cocos MD-104 SS10]
MVLLSPCMVSMLDTCAVLVDLNHLSPAATIAAWQYRTLTILIPAAKFITEKPTPVPAIASPHHCMQTAGT